MKQTMDKHDDRLLREALGRRADKVPALSDEFQDAVMAKLRSLASSPKPLSISPIKGEGQVSPKVEGDGLRHGGWRTWAWVASVAAAVVIGFFVFHGKYGTNGIDGTNGSTTDQVAVVPDSQGVNAAPSQALQPNDQSLLAETTQSSPSLQGMAGGGSSGVQSPKVVSSPSLQGRGRGGSSGGSGGGSSSGQVSESSAATAPTLADLYAAIDQMTNEAIEEADRLMAEALVREYTDDEPS